MLREIDFISSLHKSTKRDYLARVNDKKYPKGKAASLAKDFGYDYWDGDRRICYGGYKYIPGRWTKLAQDFIEFYKLTSNSKILDTKFIISHSQGQKIKLMRLLKLRKRKKNLLFYIL